MYIYALAKVLSAAHQLHSIVALKSEKSTIWGSQHFLKFFEWSVDSKNDVALASELRSNRETIRCTLCMIFMILVSLFSP